MNTRCSDGGGSRAQILRAAAECFMERGFHAASIDDVALRMGATKGIVYHHYRSKMDLFFDVYRTGMDALIEAVGRARLRAASGLPAVSAMLHAHALTMFEYHAFEHVVAQGVQLHRFSAMTPAQRASFDALVACRDRLEQMYKDELVAARAGGGVADDLDVSVAAKTLLGGIQWSVIWWRPEADQGPGARERLAGQMVRTLVDGIAARPVAAGAAVRSGPAQAPAG